MCYEQEDIIHFTLGRIVEEHSCMQAPQVYLIASCVDPTKSFRQDASNTITELCGFLEGLGILNKYVHSNLYNSLALV